MDSLSPLDRRHLRALAFAQDQFEPFVALTVPSRTLTGFVAAGLAERGPSRRPSVAPEGHRLTAKGWDEVGRIWSKAPRANLA